MPDQYETPDWSQLVDTKGMPTNVLEHSMTRERQRRSIVLTWENREDDKPLDLRRRCWRMRNARTG